MHQRSGGQPAVSRTHAGTHARASSPRGGRGGWLRPSRMTPSRAPPVCPGMQHPNESPSATSTSTSCPRGRHRLSVAHRAARTHGMAHGKSRTRADASRAHGTKPQSPDCIRNHADGLHPACRQRATTIVARESRATNTRTTIFGPRRRCRGGEGHCAGVCAARRAGLDAGCRGFDVQATALPCAPCVSHWTPLAEPAP